MTHHKVLTEIKLVTTVLLNQQSFMIWLSLIKFGAKTQQNEPSGNHEVLGEGVYSQSNYHQRLTCVPGLSPPTVNAV